MPGKQRLSLPPGDTGGTGTAVETSADLLLKHNHQTPEGYRVLWQGSRPRHGDRAVKSKGRGRKGRARRQPHAHGCPLPPSAGPAGAPAHPQPCRAGWSFGGQQLLSLLLQEGFQAVGSLHSRLQQSTREGELAAPRDRATARGVGGAQGRLPPSLTSYCFRRLLTLSSFFITAVFTLSRWTRRG